MEMPISNRICLAVFAITLLLFPLSFTFRTPAEAAGENIRYVATIPPLAMILREVAGDRGEVLSLLQPGSSPHTYEPKPSDAAMVEGATGLFYVGEQLDGWVTSLNSRQMVAVFDMVPTEMKLRLDENHHGHKVSHNGDGHYDLHFWSAPVVVKSILAALTVKLIELDPAGKDVYIENASEFADKLDEMHAEVNEMMAPYSGEAIIMFHPSFNYFLNAYDLRLAGVIEQFPGKEPTPKYLIALMKKIKAHDIKALFIEPQLPQGPARIIAEEMGISLYMLDPLGGVEGRETYGELILYNAGKIADGLS